jgi:ubiquitin thioesterase OTU1
MQFRARTPQGKTAIIKITDTTTIQDLRDAISTNLDIRDEISLSFGFPPKTVKLSDHANNQTLTAAGLKLNNEAVQVIPITSTGQTPSASSPPPQPKPAPKASTPSKPQPPQSKPSDITRDEPRIPLPSLDSTLTVRVMPDDNSCLFRAIAAATSSTTTSHTSSADDYVTQLRYRVATYITANSSQYPAPVLDDRTPAQYANWIQRESSWGGDVELDILSRVLGVEIWCCQVNPFFVRKYNESSNPNSTASEFIVLVYSGIHYDTVAVSPITDPDMEMPLDFDMRKFGIGDAEWMYDAVEKLCKVLDGRGYMTNTSSFGIMCKVAGCGWVGQGERAAVKHGNETGHGEFEQIT